MHTRNEQMDVQCVGARLNCDARNVCPISIIARSRSLAITLMELTTFQFAIYCMHVMCVRMRAHHHVTRLCTNDAPTTSVKSNEIAFIIYCRSKLFGPSKYHGILHGDAAQSMPSAESLYNLSIAKRAWASRLRCTKLLADMECPAFSITCMVYAVQYDHRRRIFPWPHGKCEAHPVYA